MSPNGGKYISPLTFSKENGAVFDAGIAAQNHRATMSEDATLLRDLQRAGVIPLDPVRLPGDPSPTGIPPRAEVSPPPSPTVLQPSLGDMPNSELEPGNRYWDTYNQPRVLESEQPVARRRDPIPLPGSLEQMRDFYTKSIPAILDRALREMEKRLRCGTYFVQPQTHLSPPPSAFGVDARTPTGGTAITATAAAVPVVTITVPKNTLVIIDRIGMEAQQHNHFGGPLTFSLFRDETPIAPYDDFGDQIGKFPDPTKTGGPIFVPSNKTLKMFVRSTVNTVVFVRLMGWGIPLETTSDDGSFQDLHTQ